MKKEQRAIAQYAIVYVDKNNKINNLVTNKLCDLKPKGRKKKDESKRNTSNYAW